MTHEEFSLNELVLHASATLPASNGAGEAIMNHAQKMNGEESKQKSPVQEEIRQMFVLLLIWITPLFVFVWWWRRRRLYLCTEGLQGALHTREGHEWEAAVFLRLPFRVSRVRTFKVIHHTESLQSKASIKFCPWCLIHTERFTTMRNEYSSCLVQSSCVSGHIKDIKR